jgi:hypothetical protein
LKRYRVVAWAGMVAETIANVGILEYKEKAGQYKNGILSIQEANGSGDKKIIKEINDELFRISNLSAGNDRRDKNMVIDFFLKPCVWFITLRLAVILRKSHNKSLDKNEINDFFKNRGHLLKNEYFRIS